MVLQVLKWTYMKIQFLSIVEKAGLLAIIYYTAPYVHYHSQSRVICNVIRRQGRDVRDVSLKDT